MTCSSHGFRTKLLRETDLTFAKLITMARAKELAEKQASNISGHNNSRNNVNRVKDEGNDEAKDKVRHAKYVPKPHKQNQCRNCGNEFKQGHKDVCPAKGKTCRACGKLNHFARVCRSRKNPPKDSKKDSRESVRVAQQQTQKQSPPNSSDDEYTFDVSSSKITNIQIQINGTHIAVTIDSGATTNILDSEAFACIRKRNKHVQLEPTQTNIYAYNAVQPLPLLGKCRLAVESNGKLTISTFYVVNGKAGSLLGSETAAELGILKIKVTEVSKFHSMKTTGSRGRNEINTGSHSNGSDANSQSDSGNREIRDRNSMKNIDINTQKIQVSDKLEELQSLDIIEPAEGPTSWVSPIVAAPKPHNSDEIRLCGDYRRPNQALLRERHPIPTVDELMEEMSGAVVFSKLDLKAGYHQIVLEENSRNITTFCTHKGLFRYKRLPFGLSCASEVFQNAIQQALHGLHGVRNIADDIIVWGKTQTQHDKNLEALLQRLVVKKLTLNLEKCKFNQPSLWFYGYILSKDGRLHSVKGRSRSKESRGN
ncbi:Transposon Tf2-6 poly [Paramuricea clavata]|uniref:Transposon Tf2-6 poly n=1 Tax=Paramuricea clavata TaxID=317549 RepID=A0A6S7G3Y4_PARCT|nr:Transposon Tf2-6 poly [Paramuricea clavata]